MHISERQPAPSVPLDTSAATSEPLVQPRWADQAEEDEGEQEEEQQEAE